MKIFSPILFIILLISSSVMSQINYYYKPGGVIQLTQRYDGVAIVTNAGKYSGTAALNVIKTLVSAGDSLSNEDNLFYIRFSDDKSFSKLSLYTSLLSSKSDLVKFVTPVYFGESREVTAIASDEFFVRLRNDRDKNKLDLLNLQNNVFVIGNINDELTYYLKSYDGVPKNALELSDIYFKSGLFEFAEPNFIYPVKGFFNYTPNDPNYPSQWPLNNTGQVTNTGGSTTYGDVTSSAGMPGADMDVDKAWDYVKGNNNVLVTVFDTGVDSLHPDLAGNLTVGYNAFANNNTVTIDTGSHGTATLGIIGAITNNGLGVSGIAGGNGAAGSACKVASYRLVNNSGSFVSSANIARAFDTARVRNAHISSNSWGGGAWSSVLLNAINNCALNSRGGKGTLILFSSGNNQKNPPSIPSYFPNVVSVGASTRHDQKKAPGTGNQFWWGGDWGGTDTNDVDVVAPTINYTTDRRGALGYSAGDYNDVFNGTSCSCPNAAGVAALIFSVNPDFTAAQVKEYLYRGSTKIDNVPYSYNKTYGKWNPYYGYGRVNAYNSVRLAAGVDVTPPSIQHTNVESDSTTYPVKISAIIRDQDGSGVPSSGLNQPKVIFRKNQNSAGWSAFDSVYSSSSAGDTSYTFYIPGSGWMTEVQYFIRASDNQGNMTTFPYNANTSYSYTLCYYAIGRTSIKSYKLSNWTATDRNYSTSPTVNVPESYKILDTKVQIYLRHTWLNDEYWLYMWSPNGDENNNRKQLFGFIFVPNVATVGGGITGAIVNDTSAKTWVDYNGSPYNFTNPVKGDYTMIGYRGTQAQGNWKFTNYDAGTGDIPNFDSIRFSFRKLDSVVSPCASLDNPSDSIANFGSFELPDTLDFYLRNTGAAPLIISGYNFTGSFASYFSVINTPSASIAAGDSVLYRIRAAAPGDVAKGENNYTPDSFENAVFNINTNDPLKPVIRVSLQTDDIPLPVTLESFTSVVNGRNITLKWITSSEINNKGFEVERKTSSTEWNKIGFVDGKGNTSASSSYSFEDKNLTSGKYYYRLKQIDFNGNYKFYDLNSATEIGLPEKFDLSQNYPNPFNPTTKIDFALPSDSRILLVIYDVAGREVKTLFRGDLKQAGYYTYEFNAGSMPSGVYFYRLVAESNGKQNIMSKKMLLIK